jgi:hypothetical protein
MAVHACPTLRKARRHRPGLPPVWPGFVIALGPRATVPVIVDPRVDLLNRRFPLLAAVAVSAAENHYLVELCACFLACLAESGTTYRPLILQLKS